MTSPEAPNSIIARFTQEAVAVSGGELRSWTHRLQSAEHGPTVYITLKETNWRQSLYELTAAADTNELRVSAAIQLLNGGIIVPTGRMIVEKDLDRHRYCIFYIVVGDEDCALLQRINTRVIGEEQIYGCRVNKTLKLKFQNAGLHPSISLKDTVMTLLCRTTCINGKVMDQPLTSRLLLERPVIPSGYIVPENPS